MGVGRASVYNNVSTSQGQWARAEPHNMEHGSTWLKGRQPFISLEQFQQHWGEQGALYQVSTGALYQPDATPQLTVLWTVQHPTPIPMGPGG